MTYYIIANDPERIGQLHTFSASEALYEILSIASVYFQLEELYGSENIDKVMIKYE